MIVERSLLELLSLEMGCMYLSDIRYLPPERREYLAEKLKEFPAQERDAREWNEALEYLAGVPAEKTARAAKWRLMQWLLTTGTAIGWDG